MGRRLLVSAWMLTAGSAWAFGAASPHVAAILTSPQARLNYLAHATIWKDPGDLSPQDILDGPAGALPYTYQQATREAIQCAFAKPGKELGGRSEKFLCRTNDGKTLRLKYWNPEREQGNREVFATVAATRLLWALGFDTLPSAAINIRCVDCPEDPMTGHGERRPRDYVAEVQAYPPAGPWILSREDHDEGWSWKALDEATAMLPPGPERITQRTHFAALTLLGVFLQHGDRKPEQQALYCQSTVNIQAGHAEPAETGGFASIFVERPDATSCATPAAAIVDVGATFGGGGRTSNGVSAKMDLDTWRRRTVFRDQDKDEDADGLCRGRLVASEAAGRGGERNPVISEEGRQFLLQQLQRLTPAHVRALFRAARVDMLGQASRGTSPDARIIDEWVTAFEDKVREIATQRCQPEF
jgi:hypothetical protein